MKSLANVARAATIVLGAISSSLVGQAEVDLATWSAWLIERGVTLEDLGLPGIDLAERARVGFGVHVVKDVDGQPTCFALGLASHDSGDERISAMREAASKQRARAALLKACFWAGPALGWRFPALIEGQLALTGRFSVKVDAKARQGGLLGVLLVAQVDAIELSDTSVAGMKVMYERALLTEARSAFPDLDAATGFLGEYHSRRGADDEAHPLDGHLAVASGSKQSGLDTLEKCMALRHSALADEEWLLDLAELAFLLGESSAMNDLMRQIADMRYQVVGR